MNSFELNKVLGAILGTCLVLLALNIAAGAVFAPQKPAKPGFDIAVKEGGGEQGAAAAKEPDQPIETLLAKASVEKGQAAAKQCQACHTFEKGGPNRVGPNLDRLSQRYGMPDIAWRSPGPFPLTPWRAAFRSADPAPWPRRPSHPH